MAEHLAVGKDIPLEKYLLGATYHLMHQVVAQLLKNEPVHTISGPWWLIQQWPNLYMHKIVRPDLRSLSFPSSNFDEEYRGECRHEILSRAKGTRASRKGPLDGAGDPPSFSAGMVNPTHSSQDVPVNLTLQLTRRESLSVI